MSGYFRRPESSWPPARDLLLSGVVLCAAAAATYAALRAAFGGPPYVGPRRAYLGPALESLSLLTLMLGFAAFLVGAAVAAGSPRLLHARLRAPASALRWPWAVVHRIPSWIESLVPVTPAASLGLFRIAFGTLLVAYFVAHPVSADMLARAVPESVLHRVSLSAFAAVPALADWIRPWLVFWTVLFAAGAMTRTSFAMVTAGALAWGLLYTMRVGAHSVQVLLVALVCLLPSRWGDAWSVDARMRPDRPREAAPPGRAYGYPMWMLGLILGTGFAAAALAKLREGGLAWMMNGTVKYHFLTDSAQAPVDWGLRLVRVDAVAVLLSIAAVGIEALVIVGVCSTRYRRRLAAGVAALALLAGFGLFQGLVWPAWWMLLLAFLPWHLPAETGATPAPASLPGNRLGLAQTAVVIALVAQQAIASVAKIELAPLVSAFDMYSATYAGPGDYEAKADATYWILGELDSGLREPCRVTRGEAEAAAAGVASEMRQVVATCFAERAASVRSITVERQRRAIDWPEWRLGDEIRSPMAGPIALHP